MLWFYREDVERMLKAGWSEADIVLAEAVTSGWAGYPITEVRDWGFVLGDRDSDLARVVYRGQGKWRPWGGDGLATCYTDGSGTTMDKAAGIGVYIESGDETKLVAENIGLGTNNRAELLAIWRGIREFPYLDKRILVRSDSEYALGILTNLTWLAQVNTDLVRRIREDLSFRRNVKMEHVDGHTGVFGNEMADSLAKMGRKLIKTPSVY